MRTMIGVTVLAVFLASPLLAQQHPHPQALHGGQGMMNMMYGQSGMVPGQCGMTPGGMMRGMMGDGTLQGSMMQGSMMQGGMADMAGGPGMILGLQQTLDLSADQVERIKQLENSADSEVQQQLELEREAHQAAVQALQSDPADLGTYENSLQEAANHMVLAYTGMARAGAQARKELTPEQLQKLALSSEAMMEMCREGRGGMMGDGMMRGGDMSGGHDHGSGHGD